MWYEVKIITTEDRQLEGLNPIIRYNTFEEAMSFVKTCIEQGYTVQIIETDEEE